MDRGAELKRILQKIGFVFFLQMFCEIQCENDYNYYL